MVEVDSDNGEKWTLRRRSGCGQKRRLLNARVKAFDEELKLRQRNDTLFDKCGPEISDAEKILKALEVPLRP